MVIFSSLSSVSRSTVAPSTAVVIGDLQLAVQVVALALELSGARARGSRCRDRRAGHRTGPTSPSPFSRIRMPSSTPAGTLTVSVRRPRTRPSPPHSRHGLAMTVPKPPQRGQARAVTIWPRNERVTCWISPEPLALLAGLRDACPGALPSPSQVWQSTAVSTVISRLTPNAVSERSRSMRSRASAPGRTRRRGPRLARRRRRRTRP